jgi:hypothetical protein
MMLVVGCAVWATSYSASEEITYGNRVFETMLAVQWGRIWLHLGKSTRVEGFRADALDGWGWEAAQLPPRDAIELPLPMQRRVRTLGFNLWRGHYNDGTWFVVMAPVGYVGALLLVLPSAWSFATIRRRKLNAMGFCLTCGYDLRATIDRCPECGTPIPAKVTG